MKKKLSFKKIFAPKIEVTTNDDSIGKLITGAAGLSILGLNPDKATLWQESKGQADFINSVQMPIKTTPHSGLGFASDVYAKLGFTFLVSKSSEPLDPSEDDDLFMDVILPEGWSKRGSGHAMWSYVYDDRGRERLSVFYKGSSHDRGAFINVNCRYTGGAEHELPGGEKKEDWYYKSQSHLPQYAYVKDAGDIIWRSESAIPIVGAAYNTHGNYLNDFDRLGKEGKSKVAELFPDYKNPFAYWD